jgi:preprotein translocase subunit SecB
MYKVKKPLHDIKNNVHKKMETPTMANSAISPSLENESLPDTQLTVHRIFTKSSLFEAAALTPSLIQQAPQPAIDLQVNANAYPQGEWHEAVLTLNVTAKFKDALLWRVQLQQAGLYTLQGFSEEQQKALLNGFCMSQLYPYACVLINQLVSQGGFAAVYLQPLNFEQLYQQQLKTPQPNTKLAS